MNSNKFIAILGLLLLLILAIGSISAADADVDSDSIGDNLANIDLTDEGQSVDEIDNSNLEINENPDVACSVDTEDTISDAEDIGNDDGKDSQAEKNNLKASNLASTYKLTSSSYATYFNSSGNIISGKLQSGDVLDFSGSFSNRNFIINIPLTLTSTDGTAKFTNCAFTFIKGSDGSNISNLDAKQIKNENTPVIEAAHVNNLTFTNNTIFSNQSKSFPMSFTNVTGINLFNNTVQSNSFNSNVGQPSVIVFFGASYCNVSGNTVILNDSNGIYFCTFGSGGESGQNSENSMFSNYIFNNTLYSIRALPSSFGYPIQVMGRDNIILNNTIHDAYVGISCTSTGNQIIGNTIYNIHGAYLSSATEEQGGGYPIYVNKGCIIQDNLIYDSNLKETNAAIGAGENSIVSGNTIRNVTGVGVRFTGSNIDFVDNSVNVTGEGAIVTGNSSDIRIDGNVFDTADKNSIKLVKETRKIFPHDIIIQNNELHTTADEAISVDSVCTNVILNNNVVIGSSGIPDPGDGNTTHYVYEANFYRYFDSTGTLSSKVNENDTLIFMGDISSKGKLYINNKVNITGQNAVFNDTTFIIKDNDVIIENITINNPNLYNMDRLWGIQLNGVSNVTIQNCSISICDPYSAFAIYILDSSNCSAINNILDANGNYFTAAILSFNSTNLYIDGNTIRTTGCGETYLVNNRSCLDGYLNIYASTCVDGTIVCPDGYTICPDGSLLCPDGVTTIDAGDYRICVDGSIVCVDGTIICVDGSTITYTDSDLCPDGSVCVDGITYCLDGTIVLGDGTRIVAGGYRVAPDGTIICPDGVTVCADGVTVCADGSVVCPDGTVLCTDGSINLADGARICADGSIVCADGSVVCPDGSIVSSVACTDGVCVDGVTYCLDGTVLLGDGTRIVAGGYRVAPDGTVICPDGVTVCPDGITVCPDGSVLCPDGTIICTDGSVICADGAFVCADGSIVCADGSIRCPDGTVITGEICADGVCVDGTIYYRNGTIAYADGTVICPDGSASGNFLDGVIPGSHMVSGVYRTYGTLLIHSKNVTFTNNKVNVSSSLPDDYNLNESYNTIAGVFIHYGGFNNNISNNVIVLDSNDPIIYGIGIIGATMNSTAIGSVNNSFTYNNVSINGSYLAVGLLLGHKVFESDIEYNNFTIISGKESPNIVNYNASANNIIENNVIDSKVGTEFHFDNATVTILDAKDGVILFKVVLKDRKGNILDNKPVVLTFNDNAYPLTTLDDGSVTLELNINKAGNYTISMSFEGDDDYFAASDIGTVTVRKLNTELTVGNVSYKTTATKTVTATLKDENGLAIAGKTIVFTVNGKTYNGTTNANGVASAKITLTAGGTYTITAKFAGDGEYQAKTGTGKLTLTKQSTSLTSSGKTYTVTNTAKYIYVTLKDGAKKLLASKKITATVNGKTFSAKTNSKGVAKIKLTLTKVKTFKVSLKFAGDSTYSASTKTIKVKVTKTKTKLAVPKKTYKKAAKSKKLTATLKDQTGKVIKSKTVKFTVNGKTYSAKTNKKGVATVSVKLSAKKTYKFKVRFAGDSKYYAVTKTAKVVIK